jgi:membrane protein implicated in regulation of membrane protease activity
MGIGLGIFLLATGLILALAVGDAVEGVDLQLVGWILTGVGALAIVLSLVLATQRSSRRIEKDVRHEP